MTTGTASARSTSTPWRGSDRCCGRGCGRIEGSSQEKLPLYLGFFEFVHNARRRGKALLDSPIELLLKPSPRNIG